MHIYKYNYISIYIVSVLFIWSLSQNHVTAQNHYLLEQFTAIKDRQRVLLTWTMKLGSSCHGIGILRAAGDEDFKVIGTIPGICGSQYEAMSFSFIDENPMPNTVNRYILELGFSGQTYPPLELNFIDLSQRTSKVVPNPVALESHIYFDNPQNSIYFLTIFNPLGLLMAEMKTYDNFFRIADHIFHESQGTFHYIIKNEGGQIISSGQLVKARY